MSDGYRLVLLRHGEAERAAARDELRELTGRGRDEAAQAAAELAAAGVMPERIGASPYVRARQTAEIVAAGLASGRPGCEVTILPGITPDDDPVRAMRALDVFAVPGRTVLVATHMPLIGALIALLVDGNVSAPPGVSTGGGVVLRGTCLAPGSCIVERQIGR